RRPPVVSRLRLGEPTVVRDDPAMTAGLSWGPRTWGRSYHDRGRRRPCVVQFAGLGGLTMASIQATRMKKGMLVRIGEDLFRVLELQHVTPGNLRGFVRVKFRNIRSGSLSDQKLRSEDTVDRATLDEREMQYLYKDGDSFHFMDTNSFEQLHIDAEALGDSVDYLIPD